jgi:nucleotide-binding universal stress UspA family protein
MRRWDAPVDPNCRLEISGAPFHFSTSRVWVIGQNSHKLLAREGEISGDDIVPSPSASLHLVRCPYFGSGKSLVADRTILRPAPDCLPARSLTLTPLAAETMFKHVLISTDASPASNEAAKAALALASALGAKVTGYYAIEPMHPINVEDHGFDQSVIEGIEDSARQAGQKRVDTIGKTAKAAGVPFASLATKANTAYEGIVDTAKKRKCDVIFMASHDHHRLRHDRS